MSAHANCQHEATKSARALCRRQRNAAPVVETPKPAAEPKLTAREEFAAKMEAERARLARVQSTDMNALFARFSA